MATDGNVRVCAFNPSGFHEIWISPARGMRRLKCIAKFHITSDFILGLGFHVSFWGSIQRPGFIFKVS